MFLAGKDITCFIAILDTRWQTFEKALITAIEAGLNQSHVVLQVEPNFTLDIHKPSLTYAIKVLIQVNGLTMKPDESPLAIHHSITYKVQTHMFSMSSSGKPITRFLTGDGRVFQPRNYRQNQFIFSPQWINEYEKSNKPQQIHDVSKISSLQKRRVSISFPTETKALYPCEKCQLEGKHLSLCTHMPKRTTSYRIMGPVTMINTPDLDNEFVRDIPGGIYSAKWVIQKSNPTEFGPIEKALNWSNINYVEQNQALGDIMVTQQQILADLAAIRRQLKKPRKANKMTTQQFSQLHDNVRPVNMIVMTGVADEDEMERTRQSNTKKVSRYWKSKLTKPWHIWEENAFGNCQKAFWRSYAPPPQYPWPEKATGWDNDTSISSGETSETQLPPIPILIQRANPANPFYVDTRARFTTSTQEHGQTSDPNRQVPT